MFADLPDLGGLVLDESGTLTIEAPTRIISSVPDSTPTPPAAVSETPAELATTVSEDAPLVQRSRVLSARDKGKQKVSEKKRKRTTEVEFVSSPEPTDTLVANPTFIHSLSATRAFIETIPTVFPPEPSLYEEVSDRPGGLSKLLFAGMNIIASATRKVLAAEDKLKELREEDQSTRDAHRAVKSKLMGEKKVLEEELSRAKATMKEMEGELACLSVKDARIRELEAQLAYERSTHVNIVTEYNTQVSDLRQENEKLHAMMSERIAYERNMAVEEYCGGYRQRARVDFYKNAANTLLLCMVKMQMLKFKVKDFPFNAQDLCGLSTDLPEYQPPLPGTFIDDGETPLEAWGVTRLASERGIVKGKENQVHRPPLPKLVAPPPLERSEPVPRMLPSPPSPTLSPRKRKVFASDALLDTVQPSKRSSLDQAGGSGSRVSGVRDVVDLKADSVEDAGTAAETVSK